MSAIYGLLNQRAEAVSENQIARMSQALQRHGSDGGNFWLGDMIGLGQRLQCFTPEDRLERQPVHSKSGRLVLVCDGRLDNRAELLAQLDAATSRNLPDSALIMLAFERWGSACLQHLVGAFALAVWDQAEKKLVLARSAICAPTLFFHRSAHRFAFATMPAALHTLAAIPRTINEQKLADMLVMSPADPGATLYQGIERLATGCLLTLDATGQITLENFWQPKLAHSSGWHHDEDALDAFKELHQRVVRSQLRSETQVGVMLSGGLDSTAIAATAAQQLANQGQRLAAFTAVWPSDASNPAPAGKYTDEGPLVRAMAKKYGNLNLQLVDTDGLSFLDGIDDSFLYLERYFANTANRVWLEAIYTQASHNGVKVLLNGMQGNLTFSRNGSGLLTQLLRTRQWAGALANAWWLSRRGSWRAVAASVLPLLPDSLWQMMQGVRSRDLLGAENQWLANTPIHPDFAATHQVRQRAREHGQRYGFERQTDVRQATLQALQQQDLGIFDTAFRARYGVDPRAPAADIRIAEFCLALPEEQFSHRGQSRTLIRRALRDELPNIVTNNFQRGLQASDWFKRLSVIRASLSDELVRLENHTVSARVLDLQRMRGLLERWPRSITDGRQLAEYSMVLERGLAIGRFLIWAAPDNSG